METSASSQVKQKFTLLPKTKDVSSQLPELFAWREFACHGQRRGNQDRLQRSLWVEEMELAVQGGQSSIVHRTEYWRRKSCTERKHWVSAKGPQVISWVLITACILGKYLSLGGESPRRIRGNNHKNSHVAKNSSSFHQAE